MSEQNIQLLPTHTGAEVLLFITHYAQVGNFKRTLFFFVVFSNWKHKMHLKRKESPNSLFFLLSYLLRHPFCVGGDVCLHEW